METWSETSLLKLKVSDLKLELKAIKLPQYGTKLILVQRLLDYKEKIETQQILTSNLPQDEQEPFVIGYEINFKEDNQNLALSTSQDQRFFY